MKNLFKALNCSTLKQTDAQIQQTKKSKAVKSPLLEHKANKFSQVRQSFPIWQITVPLGTVLIFVTSSLTAYFMAEGRFLFDLSVSREQIRIRADVDKRESDLSKEKSATSNHQNTGTTR